METVHVDICYGPLRVAWAIHSADKDGFRRAVRLSHTSSIGKLGLLDTSIAADVVTVHVQMMTKNIGPTLQIARGLAASTLQALIDHWWTIAGEIQRGRRRLGACARSQQAASQAAALLSAPYGICDSIDNDTQHLPTFVNSPSSYCPINLFPVPYSRNDDRKPWVIGFGPVQNGRRAG